MTRLTGGTLFSGIGAPELAMPQVDWRWCAETDPFASAVLAQRFPHVPNLGDVTKADWNAAEPVDIVVFGSPCQSFSVAGKRAGLDDPRGNMALVGLQIVDRIRPRWVVWENVPGVLSSDEWRDFGAFLGALGECGYGFAYRVLDAQHFRVPQRRRRVFVVGHLGDWRPAAAVLFERESLRWNPPPRREAGEGIARPIASSSERGSGYRNDVDTADNLITGSLSSRATAGGGLGTDFECDGGLIASALRCSKGGGTNTQFRGDGSDNLIADIRNGAVDSDLAMALQGGGMGEERGRCINAIPHVVAPPVTSNPYGDHESREGLLIAYGGNNTAGPIEVATAVRCGSSGANGHYDFESETFVTHSLRADGFDASEPFDEHSGGTGRGTPIIPILEVGARTNGDGYRDGDGDGIGSPGDPMHTLSGKQHGIAFDTTQVTSKANRSQPKPGDPCHPLATGAHPPAIAFRTNQTSAQGPIHSLDVTDTLAQDHAPAVAFTVSQNSNGFAWTSEVAPTIQAFSGGDTNTQSGVLAFDPRQIHHPANHSNPKPGDPCHPLRGVANAEPAIAFNLRGREGGAMPEIDDLASLRSASGGSSRSDVQQMSVRRLTPREAERLQGFPDDFTAIAYRGKPAADGPRYRALGNAMAVPVVRWILRRLAVVDAETSSS